MAAMLIHAGYTPKEAFAYIGSRRIIYGGHFLNHGLWPKCERDGRHAKSLLEAHRFLKTIEVGCGVKRRSEVSACVDEWRLPSAACSQMASKKSESPKDCSQPVQEGTDDPSNPQTDKASSSKDGLQPVSGDTDAPSDIRAIPIESSAEALEAFEIVDDGVDFGDFSDDDKSSAWTDEDEHEAWKK